MVKLGTKCPSMMSTCNQSAPSSSMRLTSEAKAPWSAANSDGQTMARLVVETAGARRAPHVSRNDGYSRRYAAYTSAYAACASGFGLMTRDLRTIAATASRTLPNNPAPKAASIAQPSAGASEHSVTTCGTPVTSA